MQEMITLYTGESGYTLFNLGAPFLASTERYDDDYVVLVPTENIIRYMQNITIDEILYDVFNLESVTVTKIETEMIK